MKIGPSYESGKATDVAPKVDARPVQKQQASATPAASVRLSDLSSKLAEMEASLAASEAFDAKRVEAIKQAISEGRFKVNPEAVAEKLLANVREMLDTKSA